MLSSKEARLLAKCTGHAACACQLASSVLTMRTSKGDTDVNDGRHAGLHIQIPLGCHAQIRLDQVRSERLDLFVQLQLPPSRCLSHSFQRCSIISCTDEADDAINVGPLAQMVHEKDAQAAGCTCDELCISAHSALRLIGQAR